MMSALPRVRLLFVLFLCLLVPACKKAKVTKANFDAIANGMSLEDVEKLLGKGDKQAADPGVGSVGGVVAITSAPTVGGGDIYHWESGNKKITVTFREGKVAHKQSTGF